MHNIVYHIIGNKSNILLVYRHVFAVFGNINSWNRLGDLAEPIYQRIDTAKPSNIITIYIILRIIIFIFLLCLIIINEE